MFAAQKGIEPPLEEVDLMAGENRQEAYGKKNPSGQLPCLALDNGSFISEVTAICEYIEEQHPQNPLIGSTAEERGETRMWTRKVDLGICEPLANGFRFSDGLPLFKDRLMTVPEAAEGLKGMAQERLTWLDGELAGKTYLCGDRLTLADILLYCFVSFGGQVGQPLNEDNANIKAWYDRMALLPSSQA